MKNLRTAQMQQVPATFSHATFDRIVALAKQEQRSRNQMIRLLVDEALAAREIVAARKLRALELLEEREAVARKAARKTA